MADTKKVTDEVKGLFTKVIRGEIELFNRLSKLSCEAAKEFFAVEKRKPLPSVGEGLTRLLELNLACWSAAAEHGLALVNDVADAYEKTLGLQARSRETARGSRKSARKTTA